MRTRRRLRRGVMYVVILMTAMIVSIIGMSALTMTRVQLRTATGDINVTEARCCAQSAIEIGALSMTNEPQWRKVFSHDTWSTKLRIGNGYYQWKLVDEVNGSLTADRTAPVRIYGMGVTGDAQRVLSALLVDVSPTAANLVQNGGIEDGTANWTVFYSGSLSTSTAVKYAGSASMLISGRTQWYCGAEQDITSGLEDEVTYEVSAWVRPRTTSVTPRFYFHLDSTGSGNEWLGADTEATTVGLWTQVKAELTPNWSGSLNYATLLVCTASSTNDFYIDEIKVSEKQLTAKIEVVPGSWRWEVSAAAAAEPDEGKILPATAAAAAFEVTGFTTGN